MVINLGRSVASIRTTSRDRENDPTPSRLLSFPSRSFSRLLYSLLLSLLGYCQSVAPSRHNSAETKTNCLHTHTHSEYIRLMERGENDDDERKEKEKKKNTQRRTINATNPRGQTRQPTRIERCHKRGPGFLTSHRAGHKVALDQQS